MAQNDIFITQKTAGIKFLISRKFKVTILLRILEREFNGPLGAPVTIVKPSNLILVYLSVTDAKCHHALTNLIYHILRLLQLR